MKNKKAACILALSLAVGLCGIQAAGSAAEKTSETDQAAQNAEDTSKADQTEEQKEASRAVPETNSPYGSLLDFASKTVEGEDFTQEDFKEKDITIINYWSLTCGPCIREMPELAKLEEELPENIQLITVCLDGQGNEDVVKMVLEDCGYKGVTLTVWADGKDLEAQCRKLMYTPTTLFFDAEGNAVGETIIGSPQDLADTYLTEINKILAAMEKEEIEL